MPDDFDKKLKSWKIANLPIIPEEFKLKPVPIAKKKFQSLKKQLKRKDIEYVINACDAGREGELIFNYIHELSGSKLSIKRLWLLSMTDQSIKNSFAELREAEDMQPLLDAARCRSESDWLIGINGTRAVTIKRNKASSRQVSTVGRVQTPTLSLVIEREHEIQDFKPQTYYTVRADFEVSNGTYQGVFKSLTSRRIRPMTGTELTAFGMKMRLNLFYKLLNKLVSVQYLKQKSDPSKVLKDSTI